MPSLIALLCEVSNVNYSITLGEERPPVVVATAVESRLLASPVMMVHLHIESPCMDTRLGEDTHYMSVGYGTPGEGDAPIVLGRQVAALLLLKRKLITLIHMIGNC